METPSQPEVILSPPSVVSVIPSASQDTKPQTRSSSTFLPLPHLHASEGQPRKLNFERPSVVHPSLLHRNSSPPLSVLHLPLALPSTLLLLHTPSQPSSKTTPDRFVGPSLCAVQDNNPPCRDKDSPKPQPSCRSPDDKAVVTHFSTYSASSRAGSLLLFGVESSLRCLAATDMRGGKAPECVVYVTGDLKSSWASVPGRAARSSAEVHHCTLCGDAS